MQYLDIKNKLKSFPVFSIKDIKKIDASFHNQRLSEWQKKNYIKKVRQGFYVFSDIQINEQTLFIIANRIYNPSYISLEMSLSIYGFIPEAVYGITSITTRNTKVFKTQVGNFAYRHIKLDLMFGYELREYNGHYYKMAKKEKAILDYFYLNTKIKSEEDFRELRFNAIEIREKIDTVKLNKYLKVFKNKALAERINNFLIYIKNA